MQYKLTSILSAAFLLAGLSSTQAQTVATFDEQTLSAESDYASTFPLDAAYDFQSGFVKFYGATNSWGSFSGFNFSNVTDNSNQGFMEDRAAITGMGVDSSANYGVCFVSIDFMGPNPDQTVPVGAALTDTAVGKKVAGAYFTNTSYAYYYCADPNFAASNYWFKLTIKGYLNGTQSPDSVNFMLADFSNGNTTLVNSWEWVDLTVLGNVDSLSFDLSSNDMSSFGLNVPAYFAMDNLITLDVDCDAVGGLTVSNISAQGATFNWTANTTDSFEIAIDTEMELAPNLNTSIIALTTDNFEAVNLDANTDYVFHIRRVCDLNSSAWDTVSFKTLEATGILPIDPNQLAVRIYPNPTQDILMIQATTAIHVTVFNALGQLVMQAENVQQISTSSLPSGLYMLKAQDASGKKTATLRFTKQ